MNVLSLFAGVGGFDLGLERAGCTVVGQVELDPFCQRVLAARWPGVERASDVRGVGAGLVGRAEPGTAGRGREPAVAPQHVDLLTGGFPCQDLSVAGKRAGLGGERSGLFWEIVRIAKATRPTWGLFENVPGLVSSNRGSDMALVIAGLRECWPVVGWRILDSRYFGVAQRRRRVFFVCGPTEAGVAEVLALTEGGAGDLEAGGEAGAAAPGAAIASTLNSGGNRGGFRTEPGEHLVAGPLGGGNDGIGRRSEDDPNLVVGEPFTLASRGRGDSHQLEFRQDGLANAILTPNGGRGGIGVGAIAHALTGEGHDASEDWTGRGTPIVAYRKAQKAHDPEDCERWEQDEITDTLAPHGATTAEMIHAASAVRRLTPLECERLQGFPDGWTCLCTPLETYAADPDAAALACTCPDSPRYRALGNAVTVNVIHYLAERLMTMTGPSRAEG